MKRKKILNETDNNSVYKRAFIALNEKGCSYCSPNKGCNKRYKNNKDDLRNWKHYRNHQWKKNRTVG